MLAPSSDTFQKQTKLIAAHVYNLIDSSASLSYC